MLKFYIRLCHYFNQHDSCILLPIQTNISDIVIAGITSNNDTFIEDRYTATYIVLANYQYTSVICYTL